MTTQVRLAERKDVPALVALMAEFYGEAGFQLPEEAAARTFVALFDDPRLGRIWLMEQETEAVGYLVLTVGYSMEFGGLRGFVDDFFVRPAARGKGLGAMALEAVRQSCQQLGIRALLVETGPDDHPARRLYARAGFTANGRVLLSQALAPAMHEA